ncbi:MAG: hypothetical protein XD93_0138 [candidate division WS6 bacterium 34_10]|uniref:Cohesin domain-containing protein n=1 Tax=candidate division WS6 bacterium 34_10 TaxID=1641389 RepID=A0A101HJA7_9BACT|nr:MAG: hypothetical protein XD93_0138 [candidate division WS6 bacterium 34_10]
MAFIFLSQITSNVSANYSELTLAPSSGTITSSDTPIDILVDSGSDEFVGVDINILFSGSIEYVRADGVDRCSSFLVTEGTGTINIECLSIGHEVGETYNGTVATLYFRATDSGTAVLSVTSTDPVIDSGLPVDSTYNLSMYSESVIGTGGDLPETGLLESSGVNLIIGLLFLTLGLGNIYLSSKEVELKEKNINRIRRKLENKL